MKIHSLLVAALFGTALAGAEPAAVAPAPNPVAEADELKHPLKPLLWKVEGKGLKKPSWLFGTIHVSKGPIGKLHPAADQALAASDAVYTEVPMDIATQLGLAQHFIRKDGKRLSDSIGGELSTQLDAELKAIQPILNSAPFQSLKTWAVAVTIPILKLQLTGTKALDAIIWESATADEKTTAALEDPADQFDIFDTLQEEEQVILLAESLRMAREAREENKDPLDDLMNAYISGEAAEVEKEMEKQYTEMATGEHKELGKKLLKRLLGDRNITMAETIEAKLAAEPDQSHFFAVGTGHYVGKSNIGDLLKKQGYKITRVTE